MPEVAECLNRRYRALDELITELNALHSQGSGEDHLFSRRSYDPGIKLMCDFWNILKEDPNCDLSHAVKQRMGVPVQSRASLFPQHLQCYMAGANRGAGCGPGRAGGRAGDPRRDIHRIREICCGTNSFTRSANARDCRVACAETDVKKPDNSMPLSKALCNLKEAASFDKKCNIRISALMETQKELKAQIQNLEQRKRDGMNLLREADSMWSNMEGEYKNKIALSIERQKVLLKQLKEVEASQSKWRRTKKDLEDELKQVMKSRQEIGEKINQKSNDIRCIELEITDFTRRISTNKRSVDGSKQTLVYKKAASDKKINRYNEDMKKLKTNLVEVQKHKKDKEAEGKQYVADARDDLQNICKVLLQKKLENEDLVAEKEAILQEIDLLKQTSDQCKDKCDNKRKNIEDEIKRVDKCTAEYKYQCIQCHECTDTNDARRLCSDCPKCKEKRECITSGDHCDRDKSYDCICVLVKEKFLNNVFDNMNTVLERQTKTRPGKALADKIVKCLKNSRNGKLNCETRAQVKTFVLNVVKKNLNLTIVGGAVKTRCELDPDSYQRLMNCVNLVKTDKPLREDKGTVVKKESCARWGITSECNCPGGPAYCACSRKAPPLPKEPHPCPDTGKDKPPEPGQVLCPHKEPISCGPECAMMPPPPKSEAICPTKANKVCSTSGCPFAKNMRAAQCVLGPESLSSLPKAHTQSTPIVPGTSTLIDKALFKSGSVCKSSGKARKASTRPRDKIIEEVMGRYTEITPIDKVTTGGQCYETISGEKNNQRCMCDNSTNASLNTVSQMSDCSSEMFLIEGTGALVDMLRKKNLTHVCRSVCDTAYDQNNLPDMSNILQIEENAKVRMVLYPKSRCVKWVESVKPQSKYSSESYKMYDKDIYLHSGDKKQIPQINTKLEKGKDQYNVKKLLHNIIMLEADNRNVEWMSLDYLVKCIPLQPCDKKHYNSKVSFKFDSFHVLVKESKQYLKTTHPISNQIVKKVSAHKNQYLKQNIAQNNCIPNLSRKKKPINYNLLSSLQDSDSKCYIHIDSRASTSVQTLYVSEQRNSFFDSRNSNIKIDHANSTKDKVRRINIKNTLVKRYGEKINNKPYNNVKCNFSSKPKKNLLQSKPQKFGSTRSRNKILKIV